LAIVETLAISLAIVAGFALGRFGHVRRSRSVERRQEHPAPLPVLGDPRFEQLVRSLRVGVITVDARSRITALNASAAAIFSLDEEAVSGRSLIEVIPSFELDQRVRAALDGQASRRQLSLNLANAPRVLTVALVPIEGGEGAIIIAADETRLHELEQMRRDFVSNVSHELRTPLTTINLMLETILSTGHDEEALRLFLPRVKDEVDRMVQMVEDLLDLARVESGRLRLRDEEFDLAELAAKSVATFEPRAQRLGVRLQFSGGPAPMRGDADRMRQVVINLVDNALRNTPADGSVDVNVHHENGSVALEVRDTGVGIPYADLPHVFERFYVVDRSRARESSGTGLGLSIVKHIVEAHRGTVAVESELGFGATFACRFPRH
jgi:two-component system phosphate regulon sensor histidine kinase PhoR